MGIKKPAFPTSKLQNSKLLLKELEHTQALYAGWTSGLMGTGDGGLRNEAYGTMGTTVFSSHVGAISN